MTLDQALEKLLPKSIMSSLEEQGILVTYIRLQEIIIAFSVVFD